jgi:hypothetical protein
MPLVAFLAGAIAGCSGASKQATDTGPTILGITPKLRIVMREVIATGDPKANVEETVAEYMGGLKKSAEDLKIKSDAAGNYQIPPEKDAFLSKLRADGGVMEGLKVFKEFGRDLPSWATPLVNEYKASNISPQRKELLIAVTNAELFRLQVDLSK